MKKRVLSLLLALMMVMALIPAALAGEADKPERGVLTYTEHIKPQYEAARQFGEDLAAVKKNGKWGYIDTDNKIVIPFQYELAYDFSEGYAIVSPSSRQAEYGKVYELGFIDKAGKYTPFMAIAHDDFGERTGGTEKLEVYADRLNENSGHFFHNGFAVIDYRLYRSDGSQVDITDSQGWEYGPIGPVNEGLVPITVLDGIGFNTYGWADTNGNIVRYFEKNPVPGYDITNILSFNQGLAPVWTYAGDYNEEKYLMGFMDRNFQWVIRPQYENFFYSGIESTCKVFGETGLAMVKKDGKYGAIDKAGAVKTPFQYEELWPVNDGLILFMQGGKYGYLDAVTLKTVIPAQYEKGSGFSDGMAVVYDGSKAFLIDRKGAPIPGADSLDPKVYFHEGEDGSKTVFTPDEYVVIEKNGKYGFGRVEYLRPLPEKEDMSAWAYPEVVAAIENDLVPSYLQNLYLNDIKRSEFCDLVIQAMEKVLEKDIAQVVKEKTGQDINNYQHTYPFIDSTNTNVLAANLLEVVSGRGNGVFDPYANITRQEAASMLMRAAKALDMKSGGSADASFADSSQVASWAKEAVDYICKAGIMGGTGDNRFSPTGSYSREQSFMTIYRLFQKVMGK